MKKSLLVILLSTLLVVTGFSQIAGIPREETLIGDVLAGRVAAPNNFNILSQQVEGLLTEGFNN
jgi:peptide/nickel transport system substrate-binding protein